MIRTIGTEPSDGAMAERQLIEHPEQDMAAKHLQNQ